MSSPDIYFSIDLGTSSVTPIFITECEQLLLSILWKKSQYRIDSDVVVFLNFTF